MQPEKLFCPLRGQNSFSGCQLNRAYRLSLESVAIAFFFPRIAPVMITVALPKTQFFF